MRAWPLLAALAGCGGAQHATSAGDGPSCRDVAQHLLALANQDNQGEADPTLAAGIHGEFERQCADDAWTPERRRCLRAADTQEATLACPAR